MGEVSEMMLDGTLCEGCGVFLGESQGAPRRCVDCPQCPAEAVGSIAGLGLLDIVGLARRSGMVTEWFAGSASCVWTNGCAGVSAEQLTAFAELVALAERERCICIAIARRWGETHADGVTVNARNAASKIARAIEGRRQALLENAMDTHTISELAHRAARSDGSRLLGCGVDDLERFALLVAAAEREACAVVCDTRSADHWHDYKDPVSQFRGDTRTDAMSDEAEYCAKAIRERSNAEVSRDAGTPAASARPPG